MTSSSSGEGFQGARELGRWKKVGKCFTFGPFFWTFENKWKKLMKLVKFGRIELILIQNESPHRVLDSPGGGGWPIFPKNSGKNKIRFFSGGKKIFESIAKIQTSTQNGGNPPVWRSPHGVKKSSKIRDRKFFALLGPVKKSSKIRRSFLPQKILQKSPK